MAVANPSNTFDAPIPGMSLTAEPKSRPWQRPPQYVKLDDVVGYYLEKIGTPEAIRKANFVLEDTRIPVNIMVDTLITAGMMEGIHTVAMGMLVAPVIREFIIANAEIDGVDFVKSVDDVNKGKLVDELDQRMFMKGLRQSREMELERGEGMMHEMGESPEEETQEDIMEGEGKPKGLMARPAKMEMM